MFGIESSELLVIALVALVVIGPKDLPRVMRWVGQWVGKARAMSRHLRTGFDAMMRESELEEMQKLWAAQNDAIMKASQLPENSLPNLAGPVPFEPASTETSAETSYDPWPTNDTPWLPAPETQSQPEIAAEPPAKPKRARKPRTKLAAEAPIEADAAPQSDAA